MVFFTCNHCGESLKKQAVEKHAWKCKRDIEVSCMDCLKDFAGKAYDAHTSCITEAEKYSGKDYVPKANANKGAKKQEAWLDTIRSITDAKSNLPRGISEVFNVIRKNDNIPRKQKGFMNFFQNSAKHIRKGDVEAAWTLLEEEVKKNQVAKPANGTAALVAANGQSNGTSGESNKRKLEEEDEATESVETPVKKTKKSKAKQNGHTTEELESLVEQENGAEDAGDQEKFKWTEVIRATLVAKNNEMKLSKLKKKVLKKYRMFVGCGNEIGDKIERKFSKKVTKLGLVVDNETVRLIE